MQGYHTYSTCISSCKSETYTHGRAKKGLEKTSQSSLHVKEADLRRITKLEAGARKRTRKRTRKGWSKRLARDEGLVASKGAKKGSKKVGCSSQHAKEADLSGKVATQLSSKWLKVGSKTARAPLLLRTELTCCGADVLIPPRRASVTVQIWIQFAKVENNRIRPSVLPDLVEGRTEAQTDWQLGSLQNQYLLVRRRRRCTRTLKSESRNSENRGLEAARRGRGQIRGRMQTSCCVRGSQRRKYCKLEAVREEAERTTVCGWSREIGQARDAHRNRAAGLQ